MFIQSPYADKQVLILDDLPEMRSSLRSQIGSLGCEKVVVCGTVKDALEQLRYNRCDVILCDYYLAGGTDGQQFLEFIRSRNLISRSTIFIMITAEKGYESVVTAAECLPDDYLLKPFTADALKLRLERQIEKKTRLAKIDALQDKGSWPEVIAACDAIVAAKDRYLVDALRIKGQALLQLDRNADAVAFFEQVLAMRAMPWATLGLARALFRQQDGERCRETLEALIAEAPQLMAAYDLLGQVHMAEGDPDAAMQVLDKACAVSPNSLSRHRAIASVAEEKGDFSRVEQALDHVVRKTKNSPLRENSDFARLGSAYTALGEPGKAVSLLEDARTAFKDAAFDPQLAAVEAIAQQQAGNPEKAAEAIGRALQGDVDKLPDAVAMVVAKACLATGQQTQAEGILKRVVQSNPDATDLHDKISSVLREHGAGDLAEALVADSIREIIQLNNEAVRRAKAGELAEAAAMLTEAANRLPANLQIVTNAAYALLFDVFNNGIDSDKLRTAQTFQMLAQERDPKHPKLAEIAELMARIRSKYAK